MVEASKIKQASEDLLEKVLKLFYRQESQNFALGDFTFDKFFEKNDQFINKINLSKTDVINKMSRSSLRPVYKGQNSNVLGRVHDSVMLMCKDDHPEFMDYAVCLAKYSDFFGRLYSDNDGGFAIILSIGIFIDLYAVNEIYNLVQYNSELLIHKRIEYLIEMFCIISHFFGEKTLKKSNYDHHYKDKNDLMKITFITNSQQQFIMLHEYGHIATSYNRKRGKSTDIYCDNYTIDNEFIADEWAANKIKKYGEQFYIPWMQLRSLLWLFEFMYFVDLIERGKNANESLLRKRYDRIKNIIDCDGNILHNDVIYDTRETMDDIISNWKMIYKT